MSQLRLTLALIAATAAALPLSAQQKRISPPFMLVIRQQNKEHRSQKKPPAGQSIGNVSKHELNGIVRLIAV